MKIVIVSRILLGLCSIPAVVLSFSYNNYLYHHFSSLENIRWNIMSFQKTALSSSASSNKVEDNHTNLQENQSTTTTTSTTTNNTPIWCPEQQIYIGGIVPDLVEIDQVLKDNNGTLCLFGYGSLCWNPGIPGETALAHTDVTSTRGTALGYRRCWAQKSTDHRGIPSFPGIVCTLLQEKEVHDLRTTTTKKKKTKSEIEPKDIKVTSTSTTTTTTTTTTEGVLYFVPSHLVQQCLEELDFREKGGYARDVISVIEDDTGISHSAVLYRGTHANPAIWPRTLNDLSYAAAVMACAIGPSGPNSVYLNQLDNFLSDASTLVAAQNDDTSTLASMVRKIQEKITRKENNKVDQQYQLYFLTGCGSNQHNQLLLRQVEEQGQNSSEDEKMNNNNNEEEDDTDAHEMSELVVCGTVHGMDNKNVDDSPKQLFAGGGHSGLLTQNGQLFLWGWNDDGQLGQTKEPKRTMGNSFPLPVMEPLPDIQVQTAAFGFSHTLVVEQETGRLYGFGSNDRGQVTGSIGDTNNGTSTIKTSSSSSSVAASAAAGPTVVETPTLVPQSLVRTDEAVKVVAAGLFHSAAILQSTGELLTFGCGRFGQCLVDGKRWKPSDGSSVVSVACGRRHTVAVDDKGRIWTFGENKYGQLGRDIPNDSDSDDDPVSKKKKKVTLVDSTPRLVPGLDHVATATSSSSTNNQCRISVMCGWSHTIVTVQSKNKDTDDDVVDVYGWGRNDKGQLGMGGYTTSPIISRPQRLFQDKKVVSVVCGSESTYVLDQSDCMWGCGWNEHGNLGVGGSNDEGGVEETVAELTKMVGAKMVIPPLIYDNGNTKRSSGNILIAAGGAHFLAARTVV